MFKCKYCNKEFENPRKIAAHTKWCYDNPNRGAGVLKIKHRFCVICGKEIQWSHHNRKHTCENEKCIKANRLHTDEYKRQMSEKRKLWLKNNPDKHPWKKCNKFLSKPCETLKEKLKINNINFEEEFSPLPDRFFSIDIFIPSKNIGLEVNGNQHYKKDGSLKEYYQERHNIIENNGIKLLEIHYLMVYDNIFINDLVDFIKGINEINIEDYKKCIKKSKQEEKIKQKNIKTQKNKEKIKLKIKTIKNAKIDFTKFGWNKKIADILHISPTHVRRFMKKYMPEFYINCFVRKSCKKF